MNFRISIIVVAVFLSLACTASPSATSPNSDGGAAATIVPTASATTVASLPPEPAVPTNTLEPNSTEAPPIPSPTATRDDSQSTTPALAPTMRVATGRPNTPVPEPRVPAPKARELRFLALGDSYTIGQSVAESERWPVQLAKLLREQGVKVADPEIIATTGWIAADLADAMERTSPDGPFDIVTLMIGVNNQFQGLDVGEYRREFLGLLTSALELAGGKSANVIVLSIPDYGVTPFAASLDGSRIAREIDEFSAVNQEEAIKIGVAYVDVTGISRQAKTDQSLVAVDGLHPQAECMRCGPSWSIPN